MAECRRIIGKFTFLEGGGGKRMAFHCGVLYAFSLCAVGAFVYQSG